MASLFSQFVEGLFFFDNLQVNPIASADVHIWIVWLNVCNFGQQQIMGMIVYGGRAKKVRPIWMLSCCLPRPTTTPANTRWLFRFGRTTNAQLWWLLTAQGEKMTARFHSPPDCDRWPRETETTKNYNRRTAVFLNGPPKLCNDREFIVIAIQVQSGRCCNRWGKNTNEEQIQTSAYKHKDNRFTIQKQTSPENMQWLLLFLETNKTVALTTALFCFFLLALFCGIYRTSVG